MVNRARHVARRRAARDENMPVRLNDFPGAPASVFLNSLIRAGSGMGY